MAAYNLEEQEQISQIKAWWEEYGTLVTTVIVAVAVGVASWQVWGWYKGKQMAEASGIYFVIQQASAEGNAGKARDAAGQLIEGYAGTAYAELGALLAAAVQIREGADSRNALTQLEWVANQGKSPGVRDLARLRIAVVLFDAGDHEGALAQLDDKPDASLVARFEDLRGDVLAALGRGDEAHAAYQAALAALVSAQGQSGETLRIVVRTKIDALEL